MAGSIVPLAFTRTWYDYSQRRDSPDHGYREPATGQQPSVGEEHGQVDEGQREHQEPVAVCGPRAEDGEGVGPARVAIT